MWTSVRVENDTLITGFRQTNGWARTRKIFFAMSFDKPIKNYGRERYDKQPYKGFWGKFDQDENFPEVAGEKIRMYFDFDMEAKEKLQVKLAISPGSSEGALKNMRAEIPHWDFDKVKEKARNQWNQKLNKVMVEVENDAEKTNFYTAMYHAFLGPTQYMDVDGKSRGLDMKIHQAEGFTNYTSFSLWDTYLALHPLFNILQTERNSDMINSLLAHYDQSVHKMLPVWSHYANENWCMIGYHSASVIADAIVKGNTGFDQEHALKAMVQTAKTDYYDGLEYYMKKGYVPEDKNGAFVSKTLKYAYDDWAIAQAAEGLGNDAVYK